MRRRGWRQWQSGGWRKIRRNINGGGAKSGAAAAKETSRAQTSAANWRQIMKASWQRRRRTKSLASWRVKQPMRQRRKQTYRQRFICGGNASQDAMPLLFLHCTALCCTLKIAIYLKNGGISYLNLIITLALHTLSFAAYLFFSCPFHFFCLCIFSSAAAK